MAKDPQIGTASKRDTDEYFAARNRELTRRALERCKTLPPEPPIKAKPVEFVELFNSDCLEKDYGNHSMKYEKGRGFRKKAAGSGAWGPAGPDEIRDFKADIKAAAAQDPKGKIARYIANDPEFK